MTVKPSSTPTTTMPRLAENAQIIKAGEVSPLIAALIWGGPGLGKTTLACTAPGKKLIVNFDPGGPQSVAWRDDVDVLDYSAAENRITEEFKKDNPFNLSKAIEPYDTIITDSLSSVQELTTRQGVAFARGLRINSNIENPGMAAFQARNNLLLELVRNTLTLCSRQGKHCIFIAHEGAPDRDKEGVITGIPIMLGGSVPTNVGVKLSEIWPMYELPAGKQIGIRPARNRSVAKTRMFETTGAREFTWSFDPEKPDEEQVNMTIAGWHRDWLANDRRKIPLPR